MQTLDVAAIKTPEEAKAILEELNAMYRAVADAPVARDIYKKEAELFCDLVTPEATNKWSMALDGSLTVELALLGRILQGSATVQDVRELAQQFCSWTGYRFKIGGEWLNQVADHQPDATYGAWLEKIGRELWARREEYGHKRPFPLDEIKSSAGEENPHGTPA